MKARALAITLMLFDCGGDNAAQDAGQDSSTQDASIGDVVDGGSKNDASSDGSSSDGSSSDGSQGPSIKTAFVIMMENHDWKDISGSSSAPYINGTLLDAGAHAEQYKTPPGNHPSEPNYIWLEAGGNLGITDDNPPSSNHQSTTAHFVSQLDTAGVTWRVYAEGVSGTDCPQADINNTQFAIRHVPQLYFDDVATSSSKCMQHIRPFTELASDLTNSTTARFNFIVPNLCHDMHGETFGFTCNTFSSDLIKLGDTWLSTTVPAITSSATYTNGGALFIVWDEGTESFGSATDGPMPFIVLSPFAKAKYGNQKPYTHSSTLRTLETIFGVPYLLDAASATDVSDLFVTFP